MLETSCNEIVSYKFQHFYESAIKSCCLLVAAVVVVDALLIVCQVSVAVSNSIAWL